MRGLALNLLGPIAFTVDDLPFQGVHIRPAIALCVYLACRPERHRREHLMAVLWPDWPAAAAHQNLRQNVYTLRQVLPTVAARDGRGPVPLVLAERETLQLNPEAAVDLDVNRFSALLRQNTVEATEAAVALYRGDFLADFYLPDSAAFEEWAAARRADLRRQMLEALHRLATQALAQNACDEAAAYARRQLALDNLRESAYVQLMQALALQGQRSEALAQYNLCVRLLRAELGVEPAAETLALAEAIAGGKMAQTIGRPAGDARIYAGFAARPRHNLPLRLTSFIGREHQIAEVRRLLDSARLVTLTGAGGCGKSRLSLEVAAARLNDHSDGVWWVELAPLDNPELVAQTVAYAVGLRDLSGRSIQEALIDYLRSRRALLILDNCEHLVAACASLAESLLRACPSLCILATSREVLSIPGETIYVVPSLEMPEPDHQPPDALAAVESVRLFIERAAAVRPGYALTEENALAVAQICRRLDGIPLAIELAAARVEVLAAGQIARRLDDRFGLLAGGSRTALPRHQTLRAAIEWSYALLSEPEQRLFARLAVFRGGWTVEAAEFVCSCTVLPRARILDLLRALVDKSLVTTREVNGQMRHSWLETIREYAEEKLLESGELAQVRRWHLAYCLEFATLADGHFNGPQAMEWTDRLEADYANVRAALEFAFDSPELVESGRALAITLGGSSFTGLWDRRSHFGEARFWLEKALEPGYAPLDPAVKARLIYRYALNAHIYLPWPKDRPWLEEAIATFRALGEPYRRDCANALTWLGYRLTNNGEREAGLHCLREGLAIAEAIGDRNAQVFALNFLLWATLDFDRDYDRAWMMAERGLSIARETGDGYLIAVHLHNMAEIETQRGCYVEAWRCWHQVLELHATPNPPGMMLQALRRLGDVARVLGDYGEAETRYRESLAMSESVGWWRYGVVVKLFLAYTLLRREQVPAAATCVIEALKLVRDNDWFDMYPLCLLGLSGVLVRQGKSKATVRLLGALDAHLIRHPLVGDHRSGDLIYPEERLELEHYQSLCRTDLGDAAFDALFAEGRSLTLEEAFVLAEEHLSWGRNPVSRRSPNPPPLPPTA